MRTIKRDFIYHAICENSMQLHENIIADLYKLLHSTDAIKSHFFNDRYENIYIPADKITGLNILLTKLRTEASRLLEDDTDNLKIGYWFNIMRRGDVTLAHSHDDTDELLSGTYYLQIPAGSGKLLVHHTNKTTTIQPYPGQFVFFHPAVEHEVTQHQSEITRISLGFNIGPS